MRSVLSALALLSSATAQCTNTLPSGMHTIQLPSEGGDASAATREFNVYIPTGATDNVKMPAILGFHGYEDSMTIWETRGHWNDACEKAQWIGVWPQGSGLIERGWNAGGCCPGVGRDDIQFTKDILAWLNTNTCRDKERTFAAGFSNGGFSSNRLACELSEEFLAVGPGSGPMAFSGGLAQSSKGFTTCTPGNATSILHFHGTADPVVPYNGEKINKWPSAPADHEFWRSTHGCGPAGSDVTTFTSSTTECKRYAGCKQNAFVELCTIKGMGHHWAGGTDDSNADDVVATDYVVQVFSALPPRQ